MKACWIFLASLVTALCCLLGCKDVGHGPVVDYPGWMLGSVQICMPTDTLTFAPGDTACIKGFAVVKDAQQRAAPGIAVDLSLFPDSLGSLVPADSVLGDTSNNAGRVYFRFCAKGHAGRDTLCVRCGTVMDCRPLVLDTTSELSDSLSIHRSSFIAHL